MESDQDKVSEQDKENSTEKTGQDSCCSSSGSQKSSWGCCGSSGSCCSNLLSCCDLDFKWMGEKIQTVMLKPKNCWESIKAEGLDPIDMYKKYLVPLCLLASICSFIGSAVIGFSIGLGTTYRTPFFSGLIFQIVIFGVTLLGYALTALIIEKLAPKFQTQVSFGRALLLVGFSATPGLLAGVFGLFPSGLFFVVAIVLSIYSIYIFWSGFASMTEVADDKKIGFFAVTVVSSIVALLILNSVAVSLFKPGMPQDMFDQKQLEESIKKLVPEGK